MHITERFLTRARPEAVWRILADVERWPEWTPTFARVEPLTGAGLAPGARYRVTQPNLRPAVYRVTRCDPPRQFTWVAKPIGVRMIGDHRICLTTAGTEVQIAFEIQGLLSGWVVRIYGGQISEYVALEARNLKVRCDTLAGTGAPSRFRKS